MSELIADRVTIRYPGTTQPAVKDVTARATPGQLLAVVGPNGCGKTSLIRAMIGLVPVERGAVHLEGRPIDRWSGEDRARRVALLSQREEDPFGWTAREIVSFGRYAWHSAWTALGDADQASIDAAMARCDVSALGGRRIDTLSGGEWQRVRLARALAQEPRFLLLDEPTASLDLGHEMEIFELIRSLTDGGIACVTVTHHLNLAARFADRLLLLSNGTVVADGTAAQVLVPDRVAEVFGWPVDVIPLDGIPQITPRRRPDIG